MNVPPEFIITSVKFLFPPVLLKDAVPEMVVVPLTVIVTSPIVVAAPDEISNGPAIFKIPLADPDITPPLFIVNPPVPTVVVSTDVQFAVPFIVKKLQVPGFPFIVTVFPEQIITLSLAPGTEVPAAPPHEFDQVLADDQLPETLE